MPELDLDAIKADVEALDDNAISQSVWSLRAVRVAGHAPRLIAEVERLRRLQAEPQPAGGAFEDMAAALAGERAQVEQLRDLLVEILGHFHPYGSAERSDIVPGETFARWRSRAGQS